MDPVQVRTLVRVLWGAQLLALPGISLLVISRVQDGLGEQAHLGGLLFSIGLIAMVVLPPLGLFLRGQVFKAGWEGQVAKPDSYLRGMLLAWFMCQVPAVLGVLAIFATGRAWPGAMLPAGSICAMALLWPNGRAMFTPRDLYGVGER